ncbi:sensor histidine kinase [Clostridium algidicarnis]|uniref:sensor histidine kinase n=1 Tax=Clostridium algidicarnis TaxID=37659 RepID=UPI001C0AF31F|nr:HAMP domain-containing sensor histidine kinase [Clostridium algidicarnis]MBU3204964.1 HAMP domain-containing histidine kinase [Clostridium algidicarnis]MBU3213118.1 HAMP domain-containing histidine kinase [Clostridium algidicarnis]MBU3223173.1 HAMP domain-containing histidine kinase [Clostridium algidicarnis]
MNWKITGRFIVNVVIVAIIVIIVDIVGGIIFLSIKNRSDINIINGNSYSSAEDFTRGFNEYLIKDKDKVYIHSDGEDILKREEAWIQVLDEEGNEVYNYGKPVKVKNHYTPVELINAYKYISADSMSTIFISEKELRDINYSYIIGFSSERINRNVISYDVYNLGNGLKTGLYIILLIDTLIALLFGYLFSRRLTKPLVGIINDVKDLSEGNYNLKRGEKGIYKEVYYNINNLSSKLRSNEEERKKLDKMREEWISNISHDIKTPLVSVKGYAEILSSEEYDCTKEEVREYSKIIEDKSNYIKDLIDDLNLSTRLKNKVLVLSLKNSNIVSLVRRVVIDILNNPQTSNVNIEFSAAREVIERDIDEILIKRVITNILYNAIVHNGENVDIEVKVEKKDKVHIFIIDNGRGIKEEELNYIFERYYRGTSTGRRHKGSGLGMAIAKDIIEAHNGTINVKSELLVGTKIEIIL